MAKESRYVGSVNFFMWAKSDEKALKKLKKLASKMEKLMPDGNRCSVEELYSQPVGTMESELVYSINT